MEQSNRAEASEVMWKVVMKSSIHKESISEATNMAKKEPVATQPANAQKSKPPKSRGQKTTPEWRPQ